MRGNSVSISCHATPIALDISADCAARTRGCRATSRKPVDLDELAAIRCRNTSRAHGNVAVGHALQPERQHSLKSFKWRVFGRARDATIQQDEDARVEQHARSLAANQPVHRAAIAGRSLVARLQDNERVLLRAYRTTATAAGEGRQ